MARGTPTPISSLALLVPIGAITLGVALEASAATPTYYNNLPAFQGVITNSVTDDYQNPGYVFQQSNAVMNAVIGQTDYFTTGFGDWNLVSGGTYCAGCNGSFQLSFTTTTVGNATGVQGVGMNITFNDPGLPYFAYITFGDGTTANIQLPSGASWWGVTAPERIQQIHFGLSMGGTTTNGSFGIDNLVVGSGNIGPCMNAGQCADDGNPCTDVACVGGLCQYPFNAAPCNDGEVCTENDVCSLGTCQGTLLACNDGNPCTNDFCDFGVGCATVNNTDPCDDANACTLGEACGAGTCGGGAPAACADDDPCTADSCDPDLGCTSEPVAGCCTDDAGCGADETCDLDTNTCVPASAGSTSGGESSGGGAEGSSGTPADTGVDGTAGESSGGAATSGADTGLETAGGSSTGPTGLDTGSGFDEDEAPDFSVCDCTTTPSPQGRLWWLMVPLGLALRRRRRAA